MGAEEDRVDRLILDCLDQPATAWTEHMDSLCAAHPGLAGELRRRFDRLLGLGLVAPDAERDPPPAARDRLGSFRLLRRLGGGGMGEVYEAHDEKLDRRVALKLIRSEQMFFAGARERFAREMRAASRLDHPNLCPVFDAGEIDGVPYLAMRYVEGETLAARLERTRRTAESRSRSATEATRLEAVAMAEKLARALHAAHEAGLVHRDVKPGNILIDADGEPVLCDFGLARDTDPDAMGLTRSGERVGTPAYMSPEQVSGRAPIDRRTDVYALGVTLYECLTLRCPFDSSAPEELYHRILNEPAPDPRRYDRGVGEELAVVVGKAVAKDPDDRFATALELADELHRIRTHQPIRSRRPSLRVRVLRWSQRNQTATGILCATLAGLAVSLWLLLDSMASNRGLRARALLRAATDVEEQNPELAFKYAREALILAGADVTIAARIQEIMAKLRSYTEITRTPRSIVELSPDGRQLVATSGGTPAMLFRREEGRWRELPLPDTGWRATRNGSPPPAVFSADGRELALRGFDTGIVHRYDLRGPAPKALEDIPARGQTPLWAVRYHPHPNDPRFLVVRRYATAVWTRAGGGRRLMTLRNEERDKSAEEWMSAAFLPDGRIVADGAVFAAERRLHRVLPSTGGAWVSDVLVARTHFVVLCLDGLLRAFDFEGELLSEERLPHRDHNDSPWAVDLDVDGTRLVITTRGGTVRLLDARSLTILREWNAAGKAVRARFSPRGRRLATLDDRGMIRITDRDGAPLDAFSGLGAGGSLTWSPGGRELVAANSGVVRVFDLEARRTPGVFAGLGKPDLAVSPAGDVVVFTSDTRGLIYRCDADGGALRAYPADLGTAHIGFARDGRVVAGSESNRNLLTWDVTADPPRPPEILEGPFALSCPPAILADGRWLLLTTTRGLAHTWTGAGEARLLISEPNLYATVSRDGRDVLFSDWGDSGGLRLWTIDGEVRWRPTGWSAGAGFTSFSDDGRRVLAACGNGAACIFGIGSEDRPIEFIGHESPLNCVVFDIDGTRIATASGDGSIRIWDVASRTTIMSLGHDGVRRIAFTSTGHLVSAGEDGTVRWWELDQRALRAAVFALDIGPLTEGERARVQHLLR